jgi:limonene-1,2-epoxide hydrolase/ketosteroid isomerase-like protein
VELARRQTREAGRADPVVQYLAALTSDDTHAVETVWPGEVVVHDPRAGVVRGHRQLRRFVRDNHEWLTRRHVRIERVAATQVGRRAVVELLAHLDDRDGDGPRVVWPVAVVAESPDEDSVVFRTYCSQWPVDGHRHVRPPVLGPAADARPGDVVGRYQEALRAGDADALVATFAVDGYFREPVGPQDTHRGTGQLRSFFAAYLGEGGVSVEDCAVTDDGVRCALEYNVLRWGGHDLTPQAGLGVWERGPDGRLAAVRIYDDVEAPATTVAGLSPGRARDRWGAG